MLKLCNDATPAVGTIAGGAVHEPRDLRLDALWNHESAKAVLPRDIRASLIRDASRQVLERGLD